jgi:hypothetical protein
MVILVIVIYLLVSFKLSIHYVVEEDELEKGSNPMFRKLDNQFQKIFDIIMKQGHV